MTRVVVVDADLARAANRSSVLRAAGLEPVADAANADAVLLDVCDSGEFVACRALSQVRPVVCISERGSLEENLPRAISAGAAAYLHEPVSPALLVSTMRAAADRARLYRDVADAIPHIVYRTYPDGNFESVNQWALEYFGISPDDRPVLQGMDLIHPDDRESLIASWSKAIPAGEPFEEEHRLRRADGQFRWHLNRILPVRGHDGVLTGWLGTATDVHDLRMLEQQLRENQRFTAAMIDAAPWLVYVYDIREARNIFASAHSQALLGYPVDQYKAMGSGFLLRLMHPEDQPRRVDYAARIAAAADNQVLELEYRLRSAAGEWRWMHSRDVVFERDEQGVPTRVLGIALDITERKERQQQLESEEEKQRFLADLSARLARIQDPEAILAEACESLGRFLQVSRCGFNEVDLGSNTATVYADYHEGLPSIAGVHPIGIFGPSGVEELKQGRTVVIHDARRDRLSASVYQTAHAPIQVDAMVMAPLFRHGRWAACLSAGTHQPREWTAREVALVETVAERVWLLFENARLLRQTVAALDTARETQRALEARTRELIRSNEDLQRFANFVSHDLQAPLRSVSAFSQLLSTRCREKLGPDGEEYLAFIRNGIERMERLIQDLLEYSRVASGPRAPASPSDCNRLLETALLNLQQAIGESGAEITSDKLPVLSVDAQLVRVFQNLIDNAIKYRLMGRTPRIHVAVQQDADGWLFSVRDNGMGFDMENADRIFRIFQRLHTEDEIEGTGVGLAVCRQIIERHGGRIWAESVPGQGSSFHFSIPATPASEAIR